ncbi:MAG: formylglycine-generating enzyme family protein [Planctomycetota bacterium]|nr:MAG: formylglycine-generating enzyme family protein [Planctomycetota bacterium]
MLVWVPPQRFLRGAHLSREGRLSGLFGDPRVRSDHPPHEVSLTRGYFIGKTPVTWKQYRLFCKKTGRTPPRRVDLRTAEVTDRHPAVNVSWEDAVAYCRWAGLRLPSEAEWELAARGSDGRPFPWGDAPASPRRLNCAEHPTFGDRSTSPVGSFPLGASPFGCLDMAGNVWEWVQDRYGDYGRRPLENPRGPRRGDERVLRGGSWRSPPSECQVTRRCALAPEKRKNVVGFRVARSG